MSIGEFDFSQLTKYKEQIEKLDESQRNKLMEDCTKQVAKALLNGAKKRTPVGVYDGLESPYNAKKGGTLRNGWTGGVQKSVDAYVNGQKVHHLGNEYMLHEANVAKADNGIYYASYVEYGHRQTPGRYVPALGKRLKASWVNGHHMLKKAEDDVNAQQKRIISLKVNKELKKYFGGDG